MAHSCPDCYSTCYCGGDIDDCVLDFEDDVIHCKHYLRPECTEYESDEEYYEDDPIAEPLPREEPR